MAGKTRKGRWAVVASWLLLCWPALGCAGASEDHSAGGLDQGQPRRRHESPVAIGVRGRPLPYERQLENGFLARRHGQPFRFLSAHPIGGNKVRVLSGIGACYAGASSMPGSVPEIKRVKQLQTRKAVTLTVFVVSPERKDRACLGFISALRYTVHIRGGLKGRPIYDGSQSPPVKRWPKGTPNRDPARSRSRPEKLGLMPGWLSGKAFIGVRVKGRSGAPLFDDPADIEVSFGRNHMGWGANCNGHGAAAGILAGRLHVRSPSGSLMSCPGAGNKQDDWLSSLFAKDLRFHMDGDLLVLSSAGRTLWLRERKKAR